MLPRNKCVAKMKPLISFRIFSGKYLLEISKQIPKTFASHTNLNVSVVTIDEVL